jgi:cell shape-determining protein MreC
MTSTKINLLLLPLLLSILLSTAGELKIGVGINSFFYILTAPIHSPVSALRVATENKINYLKNLPKVERQNRELKVQAAHYITENEFLKQKITDQKTLDSLKASYKQILPVRLSGSTGKFTVSSSEVASNLKIGHPLVSGNVLLGFVS